MKPAVREPAAHSGKAQRPRPSRREQEKSTSEGVTSALAKIIIGVMEQKQKESIFALAKALLIINKLLPARAFREGFSALIVKYIGRPLR